MSETRTGSSAGRYFLTECPDPIVRFVPKALPTLDARLEHPDPDGLKWSSMCAPPTIGARVRSSAHKKQSGTVIGYFVEHDWVGLHVQLDEPYVNGNGKAFKVVHVFGIDLIPEPGVACRHSVHGVCSECADTHQERLAEGGAI